MIPTVDPIAEFAAPQGAEDRVFFGGPEYDPATDHGAEESEAALIARLEKQIEVPDFAKADYENFELDRKYVNHDCMLLDDEDTVSTNYVLRYQHVLISQLYPRDPSVAVNPKPWIGPYPPGMFEFARTIEVAVKRFADEACFKPALIGMLQDTQTCGIAWLKLNVQQDFMRDPVGARRQNDQLDNVAKLKTLMTLYENGEIQDGTAEMQELVDATDTVRAYMRAQLEEDLKNSPPAMVPQAVNPDGSLVMGIDQSDPRLGQLNTLSEQGTLLPSGIVPEVAYYLGFNLDPVMPEDIRFDWDITRPEDFFFSKWVAHRVFMSKRDIMDKWGDRIAASDWDNVKVQGYGKYGPNPNTSDDPGARTDPEVSHVNDKCAVWEYHDRSKTRRYTWVQGMRKFLSNEVADVVWHKFFPFFPLVFNRVTGKFIPISDTRLQMPLQDEINLKRTHEREAQKACYPRLMVTAGLLSPAEKEKLENALPYAVVEVQKATEVAQHLHELEIGSFDPRLYDTTRAVRELEIIAGLSQSAAGTPGGADSATEAAIANQQMGVQTEHRKSVLEAFIADVFSAMTEMALQIFPEENIKEIVGPGAVWPILDRERMWRGLNMEVKAGASGKPDKKKTLEIWTQFAGLATSLGVPVNGPEIFKKILDEMELPVDLARFVLDPMLLQQLMMAGVLPPGIGVPGAMAPPPGPGGGGSPGPGAPPMSARSGPPAPGQTPNAPTGAPMPQGGSAPRAAPGGPPR